MDAIRVNNDTKVNQVSSRTHFVRSDSNLVGFFIGEYTMKACTKCYQKKELKEFYKEKRTKNGLKGECKKCFGARTLKYSQTEQGREVRHKANSKYERSEKGKATQRRKRLRYPKAKRARGVVNEAVRNGLMPNVKSLQCNYCPNRAQEYHHYKGYAPEHRLDVLPACIKCHRKEHKKVA